MKYLLSLLTLWLVGMQAGAFEFKDSAFNIKLTVPDEYKLEWQAKEKEKTPSRAVFVKSDDEKLYLYFFTINNIDQKKVLEAHDSLFFKVEGYKEIAHSEGEEYDVATAYYDVSTKTYQKYYKTVHSDGVSFLRAVTTTDNFSQFDQIAETYDRSGYIWRIVLCAIGMLIPLLVTACACSYWKYNKPKFIVFFLLGALLSLPMAILFSWWMLPLALLLGVAAYCLRDYTLIYC